MKTLIAFIALAFSSVVFAADPFGTVVPVAVKPEVKTEVNCVTKDKKGNCPPAPKSEKPTPKKVEKKAEAPKAAASAPAAKASEPAKK
jgi:septal ring-binding cell division protein DamX